jgi:hypothetical protein
VGVSSVGGREGPEEPEACPVVWEDLRAGVPEAPVSSMSSSDRWVPPRFCPEMEGAAVGGGMSGRTKGVSSTFAFFEEFLLLREILVHNEGAILAPCYLFRVRFAGLVVGRCVKGHGLGHIGRAVDGGAVSAKPDRQVLRERFCYGGANLWWRRGRKGACQVALSAPSNCSSTLFGKV